MAYSDYLLNQVGLAGKFVRLVNNDTITEYISDGATDISGLFTFSTPPPSGIYTVYTGTSDSGPWTPTGDAGYTIGGAGGVEIDTDAGNLADQDGYTTASAGDVGLAADAGHRHGSPAFNTPLLSGPGGVLGDSGLVRIWCETGVPDDSKGNNGDVYLRRDGADGSFIYQKRSDAWVALSTGGGGGGGSSFDADVEIHHGHTLKLYKTDDAAYNYLVYDAATSGTSLSSVLQLLGGNALVLFNSDNSASSSIYFDGKVHVNKPLVTPASAAGAAGLNVPHGTAPTSPVNGDLWTTTAGLFARINGATKGPYIDTAGSGSGTVVAVLTIQGILGPWPKSFDFLPTVAGAKHLVIWTATAYTTAAGDTTLKLQLDGSDVASAQMYFNETFSHKVLPVSFFLATGLSVALHTLQLVAGLNSPSSNGADVWTAIVIELA